VEIELAGNNESSQITFKPVKPGKNEVIEELFVAHIKQVRRLIRDREKGDQFVMQAAKYDLPLVCPQMKRKFGFRDRYKATDKTCQMRCTRGATS
jgi:hypothetical protein